MADGGQLGLDICVYGGLSCWLLLNCICRIFGRPPPARLQRTSRMSACPLPIQSSWNGLGRARSSIICCNYVCAGHDLIRGRLYAIRSAQALSARVSRTKPSGFSIGLCRDEYEGPQCFSVYMYTRVWFQLYVCCIVLLTACCDLRLVW